MLRVLALVGAVGVVLVAIAAPRTNYYSDSYLSYSATGSGSPGPTLETVVCISPWDNFADGSQPLSRRAENSIGQLNLNTAVSACSGAISRRDRLAIALLVIAMLLLIGSFWHLRREPNSYSPLSL